MARIPNVETWLWACVCVALIALRVYPGFVPNTSNDSFQYFSVAENALTGHIGYTSLIHLDAERSFGVAPAPMVTFPPVYPLAIALVSLLGLSVQSAAFVVSALSTAACLPLLAWIGNRLGWSRMLRNATLAIFVFNAAVIEYGASRTGGSIHLRCAVRRSSGRRRSTERGGQSMALGRCRNCPRRGLLCALCGLVLRPRARTRGHSASPRLKPRSGKGYAIAFFVASGIVLAGVARNIVLVGNWAGRPYGRGGNEKIVSNPLLSLLVETAAAVKDLFVGPGFGLFVGPAFGTGWVSIARALLLVSLMAAGIGWLIWSRQGRQQRANNDDVILKSVGIDLLLLVGVYVACMFYAGLTAVISYGIRYVRAASSIAHPADRVGSAQHLTTPARPKAIPHASATGARSKPLLLRDRKCFPGTSAALTIRPIVHYQDHDRATGRGNIGTFDGAESYRSHRRYRGQ